MCMQYTAFGSDSHARPIGKKKHAAKVSSRAARRAFRVAGSLQCGSHRCFGSICCMVSVLIKSGVTYNLKPDTLKLKPSNPKPGIWQHQPNDL